jgi:hypothetical protein
VGALVGSHQRSWCTRVLVPWRYRWRYRSLNNPFAGAFESCMRLFLFRWLGGFGSTMPVIRDGPDRNARAVALPVALPNFYRPGNGAGRRAERPSAATRPGRRLTLSLELGLG